MVKYYVRKNSLNESTETVREVMDFYKKISKHPTILLFQIGDLIVLEKNGLIYGHPKNKEEVKKNIDCVIPQELASKVTGYPGDHTFSIICNIVCRKYLREGWIYSVKFASNTNNLGLGADFNGVWLCFYKQEYDYNKGMLANIVNMLDNAIDAYEGKSFPDEMLKLYKKYKNRNQ